MENNLNKVEANLIKNEAHYHSSGGSLWDNITIWLGLSKKRILSKESLRVLFVDDTKFPVIDNLKIAGYVVDWIRDIRDIENPKVQDAHILFIDYKGVGKNLSPSKEGVGICKMLKDKYKNKKFIVLCTGENIPNVLLNEIKTVSDEIITKSETSDFIRVIDIAIATLNQ